MVKRTGRWAAWVLSVLLGATLVQATTDYSLGGSGDVISTLAKYVIGPSAATSAKMNVAAGSSSEGAITLKGASSQSEDLVSIQNSSGSELARFTSAGAYQIADPDQLAGYSEFIHDHASNSNGYPRTYFRGKAAGTYNNYLLYAAGAGGTGAVFDVGMGISDRQDVKEAGANQLVFGLGDWGGATEYASIVTYGAETWSTNGTVDLCIGGGNQQCSSSSTMFKTDGRVSVGNIAVQTSDRLVVNGALRLADGGTKPTCDVNVRFMIWTDAGGAGVQDTVQVCAKSNLDAYAWRTIY